MRSGRVDIAGQRFGRLLVLSYAETRQKKAYWLCRCDCGAERVVCGGNLRKGTSQSCGCLHNEGMVERFRKHGEGGHPWTPEYRTWRALRNRCRSPKGQTDSRYGGRGIKVCERWEDYEAFLADMGRRPSPKHSIDRWPNNDGDYEPGNCRWATTTEQRLNQRPRA
jgi:hypothetical protein